MASTTSTFFLQNVACFEMSGKKAVYTVYELTEDGRVLTSMFDSNQLAIDFAHDFTYTNSQVYIYKNKCVKILESPLIDGEVDTSTINSALDTLADVASTKLDDDYDTEQDDDYVPEKESSDVESEYTEDEEVEHDASYVIEYGDLDGLFFHEYGKGYLLVPTQDTPFFGQKYLLNGWWNEKAQGWFFRSQFFDELVEHGALFAAKKSKSSKSKVSFSDMSDVFTNPRELGGFAISSYGKGIILTCSKSNKLFKNKEPYLLGNHGFWNAKAGGWFFKKNHLESLELLGAMMIKEESVSSTQSISSQHVKHFVKAPAFDKYGRGWLLPCPSKEAYTTHGKYFEGGFWMPTQNGWFFRTADKDKFLELFE